MVSGEGITLSEWYYIRFLISDSCMDTKIDCLNWKDSNLCTDDQVKKDCPYSCGTCGNTGTGCSKCHLKLNVVPRYALAFFF